MNRMTGGMLECGSIDSMNKKTPTEISYLKSVGVFYICLNIMQEKRWL